MNKTILAALLMLTSAAAAMPAIAQEVSAQPIPVATTYGASQPRVALFLSGDGGWNLGVVSMAQAVERQGYIVGGIDFPKYLRNRGKSAGACLPLSRDLLATATALAREHGLQTSQRPLLVGYSSGATGVYAALLDATPGEFAGGLSLGFGSDLHTAKPICTAASLVAKPDPKLGYIYPSARNLVAPWIALQGEIDLDVSGAATKAFVEQVGNAKIVMLPKVGHGFSVERNWMPQFESALGTLGKPSQR